jgi:protein-disulfide isomerase
MLASPTQSKGFAIMGFIKRSVLIGSVLFLALILSACGKSTSKSDVQASAAALAQQWITGTATSSTATPSPSQTPDIHATVDQQVAAALTGTAEQWTQTPSATASPTPNLDATAQAMMNAALTSTATCWTLTPTPNLDATVASRVALALTGTAANQPPTPNLDATVAIQVALALTGTAANQPSPSLAPTVNASNEEAAEDDAFLGPEDAPVVIVEFGDYQCGYCQSFNKDVLPRILEKYPDQVKFVYRDFPIFGDDSVRAAEAAECAEEQGKFWEMHDTIFESWTAANPLPLTEETLEELADQLDLDTNAFSQCLRSERYFDEVSKDYQAALTYGVIGTPSFLINGSLIQGAQSFLFFDQLIQTALGAPSDQ